MKRVIWTLKSLAAGAACVAGTTLVAQAAPVEPVEAVRPSVVVTTDESVAAGPLAPALPETAADLTLADGDADKPAAAKSDEQKRGRKPGEGRRGKGPRGEGRRHHAHGEREGHAHGRRGPHRGEGCRGEECRGEGRRGFGRHHGHHGRPGMGSHRGGFGRMAMRGHHGRPGMGPHRGGFGRMAMRGHHGRPGMGSHRGGFGRMAMRGHHGRPGMGPHRGGFGRRGGMMGAFLSKLDLSDEQKTKIRETVGAQHKVVREKEQAAGKARMALMKLSHDAGADEAAIRKAAEEVARTLAESVLAKRQVHTAFREVLTDEQKQKIEEAKQKFRKQMEERKQKREEWKKKMQERRERHRGPQKNQDDKGEKDNTDGENSPEATI